MPLLGSIIKKGIEFRHRIRFEEKAPIYYQKKELKTKVTPMVN